MYTVDKQKFTLVIPPKSERQVEKTSDVSPLNAAVAMWTDVLLLSTGLGIAMVVCGLGIAAVSAFGLVPAHGGTTLVGTLLLLLAFPMLGLVAHCMDKLDDLNRKVREEFCRRFGLSDEECRKSHEGDANS